MKNILLVIYVLHYQLLKILAVYGFQLLEVKVIIYITTIYEVRTMNIKIGVPHCLPGDQILYFLKMILKKQEKQSHVLFLPKSMNVSGLLPKLKFMRHLTKQNMSVST